MIYIAGPFFTPEEREHLNHMINEVRQWYHGEELFIPMEHFIPNGESLTNEEWSRKVFEMDTEALRKSRMVFALYLGHYSDTGTAWELGYAYALGIPVKLYIPQEHKLDNMSIMPINSAFAWNYNPKQLIQK